MTSFKPALVLAVIVAIVSALIIITYNITYVDTSTILTDKQEKAVISIYGGSSEDYAVVPAEDWQNVLHADEESDLMRIEKVVRKNDGSLAFDIVVKGYKEGLDVMVGVKDGAVSGVAIVSTGEETPGLGTDTDDPAFLDNFKGITDKAVIVKKTPTAIGEVQAVTSATRSSNGVANAVNIALDAYDRISGQLSGEDGGEAQ